jgi:adenylate cyclase
VDLIAVKGKTEAVRTYGLLGPPEAARDDQFRQLATAHADMLNAYRAQDWRPAAAHARTCQAARPDLARLYDVYLARIGEFEKYPPGAGWDGVYVAKSK